MKRPILFFYQLLTGLSDALTGALLMIAPALTLRLMGLHTPSDALTYLSFIGAFVFAVGLCCLYGAYLVFRNACASRLGVVWFLTAILRCSVAAYVITNVLSGRLENGWLTVSLFDGACVLIQAIGLRKGWLVDAAK